MGAKLLTCPGAPTCLGPALFSVEIHVGQAKVFLWHIWDGQERIAELIL